LGTGNYNGRIKFYNSISDSVMTETDPLIGQTLRFTAKVKAGSQTTVNNACAVYACPMLSAGSGALTDANKKSIKSQTIIVNNEWQTVTVDYTVAAKDIKVDTTANGNPAWGYPAFTLEFNNSVGRALQGKKVVLPVEAKDKPATLCWGGDVAKMIARILFKGEAMRETYNVCSSEHRTWEEIAEYYHKLVGLEAVWVDKEDYLSILSPENSKNVRWQLEYARLFRRITDNSKVLKLTGLKQEELVSMYDGLKLEIRNIPENYTAKNDAVGVRMDEYLAKHNM